MSELLHETALAPRGIAFVNDAAARQFVEVSNGYVSRLARLFEIAAFDCHARFLNQGARAVTVCAVVQAPLFILSYAFNR